MIFVAGWFYDTFSELILSFFSMLDYAVYFVFQLITWGFLTVLNLQILDNTIIETIQQRFYVIIGIYMLFKMLFALISSIVDPNKLNDKQAGMQKIVSRAVISVVLFAILPSIVFPFLDNIQAPIVETIPSLILGTKNKNISSYEDNQEYNSKIASQNYEMAGYIAAKTLQTFVYPNKKCEDLNEEYRLDALLSIDDLSTVVTETCSMKKSIYKYNYTFIISTAVGIFMIGVMLSYTVDASIRIIKLIVLKAISPIPILSYMDPKSEKQVFQSWVKMYIKTYTDILIKLATVYFVMALLSEILKNQKVFHLVGTDSVSGTILGSYVTIFLILGCFFFLMEANKFVRKALGAGDGDKMFKGFGQLMGAARIGTGVISGAVSGAIGGATSAEVRGKGNFRQTMGGLVGGIAGAVGGFAVGSKAFAKDPKSVGEAVNKRNGTLLSNGAKGSTWFGRLSANASNAFTGQTYADRVDRELELEKKKMDKYSSVLDLVDKEVEKSVRTTGNANYQDANGVTRSVNANYKQFKDAWEDAQARGDNVVKAKDVNENDYIVSTAEAAQFAFNLKKSNSEHYLSTMGTGQSTYNTSTPDYNKELAALVNSAGVKGKSYKSIKDDKKDMVAHQIDAKNTQHYKDSDSNRKVIKNK